MVQVTDTEESPRRARLPKAVPGQPGDPVAQAAGTGEVPEALGLEPEEGRAAHDTGLHLRLRLGLLDAQVRAAVTARRAVDPNPDDAFKGLYISDQDTDRLLEGGWPAMPEPSPEHLASQARVEELFAPGGTASRLSRLAERFSPRGPAADRGGVAALPSRPPSEPRQDRYSTRISNCPGSSMVMTPPQSQMQIEVSSRAGSPPSIVVTAPGNHGSVIIGRQGIGVRTPRAAAVAMITSGLSSLMHITKVSMFRIGMESKMFAAGRGTEDPRVGQHVQDGRRHPEGARHDCPGADLKPHAHLRLALGHRTWWRGLRTRSTAGSRLT
jgi:hypothetical protein